MRSVAIYMEGGGESPGGKAALRQGMDALLEPLKVAARKHRLRWKLVPCGGRDRAFRAFRKATDADSDTLVVLLVDSEAPVVSTSSVAHLIERDRWDLRRDEDDAIHLMVQVMETWIVADVGALKEYYGHGFRPNPLPRRQALEEVQKAEVARALDEATVGTTKGAYHKIRHAGDLLARIDSERVKERCPHFGRMWEWLEGRLADSAPT